MTTSSVILCTRNRHDDLKRCLRSLHAQTASAMQLIIVDSSDTPVTTDATIVQLCDQIKQKNTQVLLLHTAPGLPSQRNRGIAHAHADILYFFDDDVELEPAYLERMNEVFEQYPQFAGGMGRVMNVSKAPSWKYRLFRSFFLLSQDYASGHFTWSGMPTHVFGTHHWQSVEVLSGCCMAYRRQVFTHHVFDEQLGGYAYMEDCDFSRRVSYQSPLFFNPAARLSHFHSPINRDAVVKNRAMLMHNYSYLFFKNFYPKNKLKVIAYAWSVLGLLLEAVLIRRWDYLRGYWHGLRQFYRKRPNKTHQN